MFRLKYRIRIRSLFIIFIGLATAPASLAATWHVPADFDSVSTAIEAAFDGDTILIAPGTYPGPFSFNKNLTFIGAADDPGSVILEVASFGVYPTTEARLEGLTFSGELISTMAVMTGDVIVSDCHFENFQMDNTYGITFIFADVEFHRCLVRNNHNYASMFWLSNSGNAAFNNCEFLNNSGLMGSAITNGGSGSLVIKECLFNQNHVTAKGGAVFGAGPISIENSRFQNNTADNQGGAVYCGDGNILNCTFIGNTASEGGALAMDQACDVYIENTDFNNNSASIAGPQGFTTSVGSVNMVCCQAELSLWEGEGQVTLDNDGCSVITQHLSLESIKAIFR